MLPTVVASKQDVLSEFPVQAIFIGRSVFSVSVLAEQRDRFIFRFYFADVKTTHFFLFFHNLFVDPFIGGTSTCSVLYSYSPPNVSFI